MPASRCPACEVSFPTRFTKCPVCSTDTFYAPYGTPTPGWAGIVEGKHALLSDDEHSIYPHQHDASAPIHVDEGGRQWVSHEALLENGYLNLEPDSIVWLNGRFYELQSFKRKEWTWWIEEINPESEFGDVPVLSEEPDAQEASEEG